MLPTARSQRPNHFNELVEGQWRSDFKEALVMLALWGLVCLLASLLAHG
ncbi:MAG: hypothetical protein RI907_3702 [Pseudomonadota bacterium]|jgi:hypothetical protein